MITLPTSPADYSRRLRALAFVVSLSLAFAAAFAQSPPSFEAQVEGRSIALTNELRAQNGLAALAVEPRLAEAAREFAAYIAKTDKLDHDADGSTPPERAKKHGYSYCMIAENLASEFDTRGFGTADALSQKLLNGWSASPTHRGNILAPDITQIGVGVARAKSGEYYAVQVFGRPMSDILKFRVTNRTANTVRYEYRRRTNALAPKQWRAHESCAPSEIRLDAAGRVVTLRPKDGGRYAVVDSGGGNFRLSEE